MLIQSITYEHDEGSLGSNQKYYSSLPLTLEVLHVVCSSPVHTITIAVVVPSHSAIYFDVREWKSTLVCILRLNLAAINAYIVTQWL